MIWGHVIHCTSIQVVPIVKNESVPNRQFKRKRLTGMLPWYPNDDYGVLPWYPNDDYGVLPWYPNNNMDMYVVHC